MSSPRDERSASICAAPGVLFTDDLVPSATPTSSLEDYVGVAKAFGLNQRERAMSEPPTVVVEDVSELDRSHKHEAPETEVSVVEVPQPDEAVCPMSAPPHVVIHRASRELVRLDPPPKLGGKGRRVTSLPPGGLARMAPGRGEMVLRTPRKLSGERGRGRLSEEVSIPAHWRQSIDPLRCHSVDKLPSPDWQ